MLYTNIHILVLIKNRKKHILVEKVSKDRMQRNMCSPQRTAELATATIRS